MKPLRLLAACSVAFATISASPAHAQPADWSTRCRMELGSSSAPEVGKYLLMTVGKTSDPALSRLDYSASASARAAVYPTAVKDVLNLYSSPSLNIGYYGQVGAAAPHAVTPTVGHVGFGVIGKDFKAIPGSPVQLNLIVGGATFGPYEPAPSSSGMYNMWFDTADTDGDNKAPLLSANDFAKLAKAINAMTTAEVVVVQDGAEIARIAIPTPNFVAWRDGLASWASKTKPGVGAATTCAAGGDVVN